MAADKNYNNVTGLKINKCTLVSAEGALDFKDTTVEFNYFEDIFSNSVSGYLLVSDSTGWHNKMSWCGDEFLILEIDKPGPTHPLGPLKGIFRIYSIKSRHLGNDTNENLILHFCSEELFLSERTRISKSYKGKKISDMVKDIAYNFLKIDKKAFPSSHIEETFGTHDIIIPNLKPLQAINWLCSMAIVGDNKFGGGTHGGLKGGASYLFYRNREGYHFRSILSILNTIKDSEYKSRHPNPNKRTSGFWYGVKNTKLESPKDAYEQIISLQIMNSYDSIETGQRGMFANRLLAIDYLRRTHETKDFDYDQYFDGFLKNNVQIYKNVNGMYTNPHKLMSNAKDRFKKNHNEYPEGITRTYPTTTKQPSNPYIKSHQPDIKANYVENIIPYRMAQLHLINHTRLKVLIPGDPYIMVGNLIYINLNQFTRKNIKGDAVDPDRFLTGRYLVTCVRHKLDQENNFETLLEVVKDSYADIPGEAKPGLTKFLNDSNEQEVRQTIIIG